MGYEPVLVHNSCKTDEDLYAFGNATGPKGARADKDFNVTSGDDFVGGNTNLGASTFTNPDYAPLSGNYYELPKGTELPSGLGVNKDGADVMQDATHGYGHRTIYPTTQMTVNDFNGLFNSLPWTLKGKKK